MKKYNKGSSFNIIVIIIGLTMLARLIGLLRGAFIGYNLGASFDSDIYIMSLDLTTGIFLGIGSGIATSSIPLIVKCKGEKIRSIGYIFNMTFIMSVVISIGYYMGAPSIVRLFATGFSEDKLLLTIQLTRIMVPSIMFITTTYFFIGTLQANQKYILSALISFPSNILFFIFLFFGIERYGVVGLAVITTLGWLLQLSVLAPSVIKHKLIPFNMKIDFKDKNMKHFFIGIIPIILVTLTLTFNIILDNKAVSFMNDGSVSAIYYGKLMFQAIVTTTVYGITAVMFPKFNQKFLENNYEGLYQSVINVLRSLMILLIPMLVGLILVGPYVIGFVFERGIFDEGDTITTVMAFTGYTSFMVAFGFVDVLNKAYYTQGIRYIPIIISIIITSTNMLLNSLLASQFGFIGIVAGTAVAYYIGAIISFMIFSKRYKNFSLSGFGNTFIKTLLGATFMGISIYSINKVLERNTNTFSSSRLGVIVIDVLVGVVIYFVVLIVLKEQLINHNMGKLKTNPKDWFKRK